MALSPCVPMFWSARWGAPGLTLSRRDTVEAGTKMRATGTSVLSGQLSRGNSAGCCPEGLSGAVHVLNRNPEAERHPRSGQYARGSQRFEEVAGRRVTFTVTQQVKSQRVGSRTVR